MDDLLLKLLTIILSLSVCQAVRPVDGVYFPSLNQTYYLSNETYKFDLVPSFLVPLNVKKHIIYTASQDSLTNIAKRTLFEKRNALFDFSVEDHFALSSLLYQNDQVPPYVRVNNKKRSLAVTNDGVGEIPLLDGVSLIHFGYENALGLKRSDTIKFGTKFCLAVPGVTTCPNDGGTDEVKAAIKGAVKEIRAELDSYTNTNNLRDAALAQTLARQRTLALELVDYSLSLTLMIPTLAEHEAVNAVNLAHGDYVNQAQINYLKRVTNSLLLYLKAMASTDARQIVSQPSLSELFTGYQAVLSYLNSQGNIPIVESRTFDWKELPLPTDVTPNVAWPSSAFLLLDSSQPRTYRGMQLYAQLYNCSLFTVVNRTLCLQNNLPRVNCKCKNSPDDFTSLLTSIPLNQFYGPIPAAYTGIYQVSINYNLSAPIRYISYPIFPVTPDTAKGDRVDRTPLDVMSPKRWYCIQFGPYRGLADFTSTPYLLNGASGSIVVNDTSCDSLRLRAAPGNTIFSMFVVKEKVIIPFYSNCTAIQLISQGVITSAQRLGYYSLYPQSYDFGLNVTSYYDANEVYVNSAVGVYPTTPALSDKIDRLTDFDMYQYNMISATCAINLNPEWIGGTYYKKSPTLVIPSIPTGFKFDQFTINPAGELSSSLQFVYTTSWVKTYLIKRSSSNSMITDEVDILDGTQVLFYVNKNDSTVIDEGNYFFGEGNNGRDCIHKAANYSYDLTTCNWQNDLLRYDANNYFLGLQKTSGVARFIDKYKFSFTTTTVNSQEQYSFTLIPNSDADFRFYVESDGTICPKLVDKESSTSGCTFTFVYYGKDVVDFGPVTNVDFSVQQTAIVNVPPGLHALTVKGTQECMYINCKFTLSQSVVELEPPQYDLISASDLALQTKIFYTFDQTVNGTLDNLYSAIKQSEQLAQENLLLQEEWQQLNFSVYLLHQYENFSDLRKEVDQYIDAIAPIQPDYSWDSCDAGIFGSPGCFFANLISTIITILIILAVIIAFYCICFKLGVGKMIVKKISK